MSAPIITSRFVIDLKDMSPDEVASHLGLQPSYSLKRGTERVAPRPPVSVNEWIIECEKRRIHSIDEGLSELIDLVWPFRLEIREFCEKYNVDVYFVSNVLIDEDRPVYELSDATIERMAFFRASWIMDIL